MNRRDFVSTISLGLAAGLPVFAKNGLAEVSAGSPTRMLLVQPPARRQVLLAGWNLRRRWMLQRRFAKSTFRHSSLTQQTFARIDKFNPQLNAFAYQLREDALARAKQADEAQAGGKSLGVLHGVPIHVKESFAVAGRPCTWGIPALKDSRAPSDSEVVTRLRNAGAVLIGATNVPIALGDWQSYNQIYGTTNNPCD